MNIFISTLENDGSVRTRKEVVWTFNSKMCTVHPFELPQVEGMPHDLSHARGMTYTDTHMIFSFHLKTQQDALLCIPFDNFFRPIWIRLKKVKEIHSIVALNNFLLAINSTKTDDLIILPFDVYNHKFNELLIKHFGEVNSEDTWHFNSLYTDKINNGIKLYGSAFRDSEKHPGKAKEGTRDYGIIMIMKPPLYDYKVIRKGLHQPHSVCVSKKLNKLCFCESGLHRVHIGDVIADMGGYTRGMIEDVELGGFWVGLSCHRHGNDPNHYKIPGAAIRFVSYDGEVGDLIDLRHIGHEVFDLEENMLKKG